MDTVLATPEFDIYSREFEAARYDIYGDLRRDFPVFWHEQTRSWMVSRYEDVAKLLVGDTFVTSPLIGNKLVTLADGEADAFSTIVRIISTWMIYNDRPVHTRARQHMSRAFWTQELEAIRPAIRDIVQEQVRKADVQGREFDFVRTVAHPIPALVLCQMLGISGDDVERFIAWSDDIAVFMQDFVVHPTPDATISEQTSASMAQIHEYLTRSIADRRARPRNDLLSRMVSTSPSADGELFDEELINQVIHLIFGGHKIPQFLLSNAVHLLFTHPQARQAVEAGQVDVAAVVDEAMRVEAPIQYITRHAARDVVLHGQQVARGDSVYFLLGAAGRDETAFEDAAQFRPGRVGPRSLGFGGGYHACIAGAFARMEVEEILRTFLDVVPQVRPAYDTSRPQWTLNPTFHGLLQMPVQG